MTPLTKSPALETKGLSRRFGGIVAVSGVDLRVEAGARRGIIGPNGAGKTTLFNLLSGDLAPSDGTVELFGKDVSALSTHQRGRRGMGRTYQISRRFDGLTVRESMALGAVAATGRRFQALRPWKKLREVTDLVEDVASRVGLSDRLADDASALSHGELRQLELGVTLAARPQVLLLDEPAAGLSVSERVAMAELIASLPEDLTIVMVEHDMDIVRKVVDEVTVMHYGEVLVHGPMDEIERDPEVLRVYLGEEAA